MGFVEVDEKPKRKRDQPKVIPCDLFEEVGFRADLIINNLVLVELKSVAQVNELFKKTTWNYLRLVPLQLGFLINFNELHLKDGITRITNGSEGKTFFGS